MTPEEWLNWYHGVNAWSGFALLALGGWTIFRSDRKDRLALPLYLISVGGALIFMNVAAGLKASAYSKDIARTLFVLGNLFLPLQSLMLLAYAAEQAAESPKVRGIAKAAVVLVALCATGAIVAALVPNSHTLSVSAPEEAGTYSQTRGSLGQWLFVAPQHIGIPLALGLLAWTTRFPERIGRRDWMGPGFVLAGLMLMAGYATAAGLSYNWAFRDDPTEYEGNVVFGLLAAASIIIAVIIPLLMLGRSKAAWPWAALTATATVGGLFAGAASLPWFAIFAPGVIRLVTAAALLAPTLLLSGQRHQVTAVRVIPAVAIVGCALAAISLKSTPDWQPLAAGLTLTAFFIIVSLALRSAWSDLRFVPER